MPCQRKPSSLFSMLAVKLSLITLLGVASCCWNASAQETPGWQVRSENILLNEINAVDQPREFGS